MTAEAAPQSEPEPKPKPEPPQQLDGRAVAPRAEAAPAPEPPARGSGSVSLSSESVSAETLYVIGSQTVRVSAGQARQTKASFERRPWEKVLEQSIVADEELELRTSAMLGRHRIVVLAGEAELGKATLALAVARRTVGDARPVEVLVNRDLDETIVVSLESWAAEASFRNRVLVLKDGFALRNRSLLRLGERLTREYLEELAATLRAAELFVIVTSDSEHVPPAWNALENELLCRWSAPPAARLSKILDQELASFANRNQFGKESSLAFSAEERERIVSRIKTIPRLLRFRRDSFEALARKQIGLDDALDGFEDLTRWFMHELKDHEPAAWCLALSTCLLQADPLVRSSPFGTAYTLAGELARHLQTTGPGWRRRRVPAFVEPDHELLQRASLELVEGDEEWELGDQIRFSDASTPTRLWNVLRRSGRGLSRALGPLLEGHARDPGSPLYAPAMTALGRMSMTSGVAPVLVRASELAQSDDTADHVLLGRYLVGVAAGGSTALLDRAIEFLRAAAEQTGRPGYLIALREVGLNDLARAVAEIALVTQRHVRPRLLGAGEIGRVVGNLLRKQPDAAGGRNEAPDAARRTVRRHDAVLSVVLAELFDEATIDVLGAAAFATTGLCFGRDTVDVCMAFLRHFTHSSAFAGETDDPTLGAAIALLFFDPGGVFSVLERHKDRIRESDGAEIEASRVCVSLANEPATKVGPFAEFLERSYASLAGLPSAIAEPCHAQIVGSIKTWCLDGVRSSGTRTALVHLLRRLRKNPASPLGEVVTSLLKNDGDFRKPRSPLQELAVDVLTAPRGASAPGAIP